MSLFDRVRATGSSLTSTGGIANRLTGRGKSLLDIGGSNVTGRALNARGQVINRVGDAQNALLSQALGAVNSDSLLGKALGGIAEQLGVRAPRKKPKLPAAGQRATWTPAPHWGGLSGDEFYNLFIQSAMTAKSWKNLFHLSIEELTPSAASPLSVSGLWNMLATEVSFAPCTMPGDSVQIGSANMDNLASADRVEMRVTTMDDAKGSIKRWFMGKSDQAAHRDGTFGLPVDYLVVIRVAHMAPTNIGGDDERLRHAFLMRPSNLDIELSRSESALEMLQMSFVQFDSFMERP